MYLPILDDFAVEALDPAETADFYKLVFERYLKSATLVAPNRAPLECFAVLVDLLLVQCAIDRLQTAA